MSHASRSSLSACLVLLVLALIVGLVHPTLGQAPKSAVQEYRVGPKDVLKVTI